MTQQGEDGSSGRFAAFARWCGAGHALRMQANQQPHGFVVLFTMFWAAEPAPDGCGSARAHERDLMKHIRRAKFCLLQRAFFAAAAKREGGFHVCSIPAALER